ncbi:hypothetical protein QFC21_005220 [Naganishia friedmannii]|uniref:Uncharacterized protein n=1 Tax=Naganishia friedmannii TaxID=89922 RepID=A0ACC2VAN3_9TREE|nr:hypothetical protein QFC21_005220 [Naganishia friedmannii]
MAGDRAAALAKLKNNRNRQAEARGTSPDKIAIPEQSTSSAAYSRPSLPGISNSTYANTKILAPESSPIGPQSKYYGGAQSTAPLGPGAAAIRTTLFGGASDTASMSMNKPRRKEPELSEAEREELRQGKDLMQGLMSMAGGHQIARPDSRASTHDGDGLPPRKKQAVDSGSQTPSSPIMGSRSGSASVSLPGRLQSGLKVTTSRSDSEGPSSRQSTPPFGFGASSGPQRISLVKNPAANGSSPVFSAAVSTPDRQAQGTGSTSSIPFALNPDRLKNMFTNVRLERIEQIVINHGDEPAREVLKRLVAENTNQPYRPPGVASIKTIKPVATRAPVALHPQKGRTVLSSPVTAQPVPKKNIKMVSAIYANRSERKPTQAERDEEGSPIKVDGDVKPSAASPKTAISISDEEMPTDDDSDVEGAHKGKGKIVLDEEGQDMDEVKALEVFNTCPADTLTGTIVCSAEQAETIISLRPFATVAELRKKLTKKRGVSFGLFEQYIEVIQGYIQVDRCLTKCENIGKDIAETMEIWTGSSRAARSRTGTPDVGSLPGQSSQQSQDTGLHITSVDVEKIKAEIKVEQDQRRRKILKQFVTEQPPTLKEGAVLKDYQLLGVNWLYLLYSKGLSCILADDMGLGKTMQVISFMTLLRERGTKGPHLIIVPSSTLENWVREFQKFSPEIDVRTYYGSQNERFHLREEYMEMADNDELEVLLTTYDMAWKPDDNKFLRRKIKFECCIFDEGHTLKNFESQRYKSLIQIRSKWRLLLTGTPLQNNLQELVSLLNFIHEDIFEEAEEHLRQIFKVHIKGSANMLSQQRVSRARAMMTPFVLRRRKAQVLKDLPPKTDKVIECEMPPSQKQLYLETLRRSSSALAQQNLTEAERAEEKPKRGRKAVLEKKNDASANILMDLRKAALHPLLFRKVYDDKKIRQLARDCMIEPEFSTSNFDLIVEDMEVMSDAELYFFCERYRSVKHHALDMQHFMDVAKVKALQKVLKDSEKEDKRLLVFSQFTQMLDILQVILKHLNIQYIRLDGSTKVDERQSLVDEFTNNNKIKVFLLSTKAGGMGINLVAASVVCIFDQDFNPHNDRQAADRAYRIARPNSGSRSNQATHAEYDRCRAILIPEDIYRIGITKLKLDDAVGGNGSLLPTAAGLSSSTAAAGTGADGFVDDTKAQSEVKKSLLSALRQKLVDEEGKIKEVTEEVLETSGGGGAAGVGEVVDDGVVHLKVE